MAEVRNETLTGEIEVDGNVYVGCFFDNAFLNYRGGTPPGFDGCNFDRAAFRFHDAAANTLTFLRAMSPRASNMRGVVMGLIPELQD